MTSNLGLSKSLYTTGIQCPKYLWLKKYNKKILTPPSTSAKAGFETGKTVGDFARNLFPKGQKVSYDPDNFISMAKTTQQWLHERLRYIYEATFIYDDIVVMVDILRQTPKKDIEIYEVKSSTTVKDIYLHDVSIQKYVLEKLGYKVVRSYLIHINGDYIRDDELDKNELFSIVDISPQVDELQNLIPQKLEEFYHYLADTEHEPDIEIGSHCYKPYKCDAINYCWKEQRNIPEYSIFNIFKLGSEQQKELYDQGIINIEDIPDNFPMTDEQKQKVNTWKNQETMINQIEIDKFLNTLTYPLYHLNFETFQQAIPQWKGLSPYQQIPFQYSLHIEYEDGKLEHKEFLAPEGMDPREALTKQLIKDIPSDVSILTYKMNFSQEVIQKLAEAFPEFSSHLLTINENMRQNLTPTNNVI